MAKFVKTGDSIIAKHVDGHTRKYDWKGPKTHPILNKRMTEEVKYRCFMFSDGHRIYFVDAYAPALTFLLSTALQKKEKRLPLAGFGGGVFRERTKWGLF